MSQKQEFRFPFKTPLVILGVLLRPSPFRFGVKIGKKIDEPNEQSRAEILYRFLQH